MRAEGEMGSREKDLTTSHQPLLSSLVVRPTDSGGGGGGAGAGSDYEPGEVRRDPLPYSRSDRIQGYKMRAGSISPLRHRNARHRSSHSFRPSNGATRAHIFSNEREPARYRDYSPPYGRGKGVGRFPGRGYDQSARGSIRLDGFPRNNPNVQPREGDWICSDPSCKNLNFARRDHCNNCNRPRYASPGSPRRGYPGPTLPPRQRVPPLDHLALNGGYRSPPHGWPRDAPRDFRASGPPLRNDVRFLDHVVHGDRHSHPDDIPRNRDRFRFDRPLLPDLGHRDGGRDNNFFERRGGYGRRASSPPTVAPRGWVPHFRDRSRSPDRGDQRDLYMNRRRDDRRGGY